MHRFFWAIFLLGLSAAAQDPAPRPTPIAPAPVEIRGTLVALADQAVALRSGGKEIRLAGKDERIKAILGDERLLGKELEATGHWLEKDRKLEVQELHSLRRGKRHEIMYFCEICNIWAFQPGPCVCCQEPVELRELLPEEAQKARVVK